MKIEIQNDIGLPDLEFQLLCAAANDYDSGGSDFTATSLAKTPMQHLLSKSEETVKRGISNMLATIIGTLGHKGLEYYAGKTIEGALLEERFVSDFTVDGKVYTVSAQIDLFAGKILVDHKFLSTFSAGKHIEDPEAYEFQMQLGAFLCREAGHSVDDVRNFIYVKNARGNESYQGAFVYGYEQWTDEQVRDAVAKRVRDIQELRPCTDEERWAKPERYNVVVPGKSSGRIYGTIQDAEQAVSKHKSKIPPVIHVIPATYSRCENFCEYASICPQMQVAKQDW